jgi:3-oxoacyl-[acyl-carrier-protein] synthase II
MSVILGIGMTCAIGDDTAALGRDRADVARTGAFTNKHIAETPFVQGVLEDAEARNALDLALAACLQAIADSGLDPATDRIAVIVATGAGDTGALEARSPEALPYDLVQDLADALGCRGVLLTVATACSSASYGVSLAADLLEQGHDPVLLCGVEAKSDSSQFTFKALLALDHVGCFPFSEQRRGTVLGAGAAALMLSRNVPPGGRAYGTIASVSLTCDAHHDTAPDPDGHALRRGMRVALERAGCGTADIDLFLPHATGTRLNDEIEHRLLSEEFGEHFEAGQVMLLKGHIGHTCGASSAFSMIAAAIALQAGAAGAALIGASAFGGNNAAVVMKGPEVAA